MFFAALLIIFILSRAFTLMRAGSLWFDESFSVHVATQPWQDMVKLLAHEHNPWGHFLILRATSVVFGQADWVMRAPSFLAGVATCILLYILGKRMFTSSRVGLGAAFFLTISTLHLYHQTEARMYACVSLFAVLAMWSAWEWLSAAGRKKTLWLCAYAFSSFALIHLHVTAWLYVAALAMAIMAELLHRKASVRAWVIVHGLVALSGIVWLAPILWARIHESSTAQGWFFAQQEQGFALTHLVNFLLNGESNLLARSVMTLIMVALILAAFLRIEKPSWWQTFRHLFDREEWPMTLSFHWSAATRLLLATGMLTMLMGFALQITVTKYLISASIPLFLLMAVGLSRLPQKVRVVVVMAMLALVLPLHARLLAARHHWDVVAGQVERLQQENPNNVTIVHSFAYALPLRRYMQHPESIIPFYPLEDGLAFDEAVATYNWLPIVTEQNVNKIDSIIGDHAAVILISSTVGEGERDPLKRHLWQEGYKLVELYQYDGYGDPEVLVFHR